MAGITGSVNTRGCGAGSRFWPIVLLAGTLTVVLAAAPAAAQEPEESLIEAFEDALEEEAPLGAFAGDIQVVEAFEALFSGKFIRARELTEQILTRDPESIPGHCLLGIIHHRSEGNLPLALYHLKRSRRLLERRYGRIPFDDSMIGWHSLAITELAAVSGSMGRHRDKVRYLLEYDALYEPSYPADRSWPLMRLRRYDAALAAAIAGLERVDQPDQIATARTALCAIEAEQQHRQEAYEACLTAAAMGRQESLGGPTVLTNAAEAALGVLRFDEAEDLTLEAAEHFVTGTVSNPWLDLMLLYLGEGRISEALDALRRMFDWRNRQPAVIDEQNRAETDLASALFLVVAGHPVEAARITTRTLARPDRTGYTSSESEQMEAASALVDRVAQGLAAELAAEAASYASLGAAVLARLESQRRRLRAWTSGRRAAALLADERILLATLRPYLAGAVEIPEWIAPELCAILGPGVVSAALGKARERETLAAASGYFRAWEAEIALLQGRARDAVAASRRALAELPSSELLLRARVAAIGAQAALEAGAGSEAIELFDHALQIDPGVVRRLGAALPTAFEATPGPIAEAAVGLLRRSPRFVRARGGFRVRVEGLADAGTACLVGPRGTVLACAEAVARAGEGTVDVARRLARELHAAAFAPRIDLTQADLRSLDGSPTAGGGRSRERLKTVLSELVGDGDD